MDFQKNESSNSLLVQFLNAQTSFIFYNDRDTNNNNLSSISRGFYGLTVGGWAVVETGVHVKKKKHLSDLETIYDIAESKPPTCLYQKSSKGTVKPV